MKPLNPKQKRVLEVAGVAGLVLLVVMLAKRQNAGAADPTGGSAGVVDPNAPGSGAPGDFSGEDSGNFADFANTWAGALGDLGTGVSQLGANQDQLASGEQSISDAVLTLGGSLAATQASVDAISNQLESGAFAPATGGTPGPAAPTRHATSVPKTQTIIKASAAHGGKPYVYHVTPGKKPVLVRAATHAAPAKKKPAVRKPAPKKKPVVRKPAATHRSPSQAPRGSHRAPARKKASR